SATRRGIELYAVGSIASCLTEGLAPAAEAISEIESMLEDYGDNRPFWLRTLRYLSVLYAFVGDFERARSLAVEGTTAARELGMEVNLSAGHLRSSAVVARLAGDIAQAEQKLREAAETLRRLGDRGHLDSVAPDLAG